MAKPKTLVEITRGNLLEDQQRLAKALRDLADQVEHIRLTDRRFLGLGPGAAFASDIHSTVAWALPNMSLHRFISRGSEYDDAIARQSHEDQEARDE